MYSKHICDKTATHAASIYMTSELPCCLHSCGSADRHFSRTNHNEGLRFLTISSINYIPRTWLHEELIVAGSRQISALSPWRYERIHVDLLILHATGTSLAVVGQRDGKIHLIWMRAYCSTRLGRRFWLHPNFSLLWPCSSLSLLPREGFFEDDAEAFFCF